MRLFFSALFMAVVCVSAGAQNFAGRFVGRTEEGAAVEAVLRQDAAHRVTGSLTQDGTAIPLSGKASGTRFSATIRFEDQTAQLIGVLNGSVLKLTAMGQTITLTRAGSAPAAVQGSPKAGRSRPRASGAPNVRINGVRLDPALIRKLETKYRLQFVSGDYWYDRRCGAWGVIGRGASGVVRPGIAMGGPLRRGASGGDTGVFVNGRELHALEVMALRQLGPVIPGHYWVDSRWNYGREGGPAMGNIIADAQARQVPRQGILSTWDRTGVAIFDLR